MYGFSVGLSRRQSHVGKRPIIEPQKGKHYHVFGLWRHPVTKKRHSDWFSEWRALGAHARVLFCEAPPSRAIVVYIVWELCQSSFFLLHSYINRVTCYLLLLNLLTFVYVICGMTTEGDNVFEAVMARCVLRVDEGEVGVATATGTVTVTDTVPGGEPPAVIGVTREELDQLLDDYRLDRLVESDGSDGGGSSTDSDSGAEDADRATVVVEAAATGRQVEEGNVAENADTEIERAEVFNCRCPLFEDGACCRQFSFAEIANSRIHMRDITEVM